MSKRLRLRPGYLEGEMVRSPQQDLVADRGKGHEAVEIMVAVCASTRDMQVKIELGWGEFVYLGHVGGNLTIWG